jgi:hypothetical protein
MIKDNCKVHGKIHVVVRDATGKITQEIVKDNLIVTTGLALLASRCVGNTDAAPSHMAIGSSLTAPALGDTTLGTELGRVALTSATSVANVVTYVADFPAGTGTGVVAEAGTLNAAVAGALLNRVTFGTVTKSGSDSMQITWIITLG